LFLAERARGIEGKKKAESGKSDKLKTGGRFEALPLFLKVRRFATQAVTAGTLAVPVFVGRPPAPWLLAGGYSGWGFGFDRRNSVARGASWVKIVTNLFDHTGGKSGSTPTLLIFYLISISCIIPTSS
jgi:hypothetical protein